MEYRRVAVEVSGAGRGTPCAVPYVAEEAPYWLEESVGRRIGESSGAGKGPSLVEEVELGRILQVGHNLDMSSDSWEGIAEVVDPVEEGVNLEGTLVIVVGMQAGEAQDRSVRSGS